MEQHNHEIANSIRALAKSRGVTVKQTLCDCGINRNFLYDLEHGDSSPSVDKLARIAAYFDVSTASLLGDAAGEAEAFLELYRRLSPADRAALRDYMTKLLSES
ncbi:MAG: helix-turn-helix transcriptional regulator [Clostridia bacterium]|nr:helix-turn-helix transcriptional regulator [Clostridia bacterium]